jgi:hypothetical protein
MKKRLEVSRRPAEGITSLHSLLEARRCLVTDLWCVFMAGVRLITTIIATGLPRHLH